MVRPLSPLAAKWFCGINMENLEIKQLGEKDKVNADALISSGKSSKASIEPIKMRKSCCSISLKGGNNE